MATKLTGEVTVAPSNGAQITTPGEAGAAHGGVVVPVPDNATACGLPGAESATVTAPVRGPLSLGVKLTNIVQLNPASSDAPQLFDCRKSPLAAIPEIDMLLPPELVSVMVCALLEVPTCWPPKSRLVGDSVASGPDPLAM